MKFEIDHHTIEKLDALNQSHTGDVHAAPPNINLLHIIFMNNLESVLYALVTMTHILQLS